MFLCVFKGCWSTFHGAGETLNFAFDECETAANKSLDVNDCAFYRVIPQALNVSREIREITD